MKFLTDSRNRFIRNCFYLPRICFAGNRAWQYLKQLCRECLGNADRNT